MNSEQYADHIVHNGQAEHLHLSFISSSNGSQTFASIDPLRNSSQDKSSQNSYGNDSRLSLAFDIVCKIIEISSSFSLANTVILQNDTIQQNQNQDILFNQIENSEMTIGEQETNLIIIQNFSTLNEIQSSTSTIRVESSQQISSQLYSEISESIIYSNDLNLPINLSMQIEVSRGPSINLQAILSQIDNDQNNIFQNFDPNYQFKQLTGRHKLNYQLRNQVKLLKLQKSFLGQTSPQYAESLNITGLMFKKKGNYQRSLDCFSKGLKIIQQNYGKQNQKYIQSFYNVCEIETKKCNYKSGHALTQQLKFLALKVLGENNALFANILHINGLAKAFFGNDSEALDIFKKSIYIKKELQDFQMIQRIKIDMAYSYCAKKKYFYALKIVDQLRQQRKKLGIIDYDKQALFQNLYGTIYKKQKLYQKSLQHFKSCEWFVKKVNGKQHQYVSIPLKHIGQIYLRLKDYSKAKQYLEKSLKI